MLKNRHLHPLLGACLTLAVQAVLAAPAPPALEGVDWQLVQYRTGDGMRDAKDGAHGGVLRFDAGRLSGSAGCNRLMGAYHVDVSTLRFEPHTASTMMACPPALMDQEQAVVAAFSDAAGYRIADGELEILDADGNTLLSLAELQAAPLTGTSWRMTWYNNGKQAVVSALEDAAVMLRLRADGQFAGKACNSYRGRFEQDGSAFRVVGPIAATRMACPQDGVDAQEAAYFAALERAAAWRISGDELTLTDADGTTQLKFQAVAN